MKNKKKLSAEILKSNLILLLVFYFIFLSCNEKEDLPLAQQETSDKLFVRISNPTEKEFYIALENSLTFVFDDNKKLYSISHPPTVKNTHYEGVRANDFVTLIKINKAQEYRYSVQLKKTINNKRILTDTEKWLIEEEKYKVEIYDEYAIMFFVYVFEENATLKDYQTYQKYVQENSWIVVGHLNDENELVFDLSNLVESQRGILPE